jgi:cystathionine beta-lyase/cystathionine gamma-synthase
VNKLAILGGKPTRDTYLSYGKQTVDESDIQAVVDVLKGDYLTTGPFVKEFEDKVANYVGAKYAVAVSNGTAALHMACFAAGIKKGDEVIVSPMTFAASANAVLNMNIINELDSTLNNIQNSNYAIYQKTSKFIDEHYKVMEGFIKKMIYGKGVL